MAINLEICIEMGRLKNAELQCEDFLFSKNINE